MDLSSGYRTSQVHQKTTIKRQMITRTSPNNYEHFKGCKSACELASSRAYDCGEPKYFTIDNEMKSG